MRATTLLSLLSVVSAAAVAIACGSMSDSEASFGPGGDARGDAGFGSPGVGGEAAPQSVVASGIVLVHAATFPSFRLCFENLPAQRPSPEASLKPNANVVGVEVGSAVRIDPLSAPGTVYVIDVGRLAGGRESATCGELLGPGGLLKAGDYFSLPAIDEPIGAGGVELFALHGCGNDFTLADLGATSADCGAGYDALKGNLAVTRLPLVPQTRNDSSLPVQLVHLSPLLDAQAGGRPLEVTFGDLSLPGTLGKFVAQGLPLFAQAAPVQVSFDDADQAVYGTHGFRIAQRGDGGTDFELDQSLADVQDLSAPDDVPSTYYAAASNYVLLLLGDPRIKKSADGGAFDARRALHLLAVPVIDPLSQDAGTDDGGDGG